MLECVVMNTTSKGSKSPRGNDQSSRKTTTRTVAQLVDTLFGYA